MKKALAANWPEIIRPGLIKAWENHQKAVDLTYKTDMTPEEEEFLRRYLPITLVTGIAIKGCATGDMASYRECPYLTAHLRYRGCKFYNKEITINLEVQPKPDFCKVIEITTTEEE